MADESGEEEEKKRQSPPPVEFLRPGETQAPLPPRDQPPAAWVTRPEEYLRPTTPAPQPRALPGQLHQVAGILFALSGLVAIGWTIVLSVRFPSPAEYANATANVTPEIWAASQICGLVGIWGQAIALLAGVMAFRRLNWKFVFSAAIFSVLAIGAPAVAFFDPYFGGAAGLGLVGLILLAVARREFLS